MDFEYWDQAPVGAFSLRQARRLMSAVSADTADAIRQVRNHVAHHNSVDLKRYPLADLSVPEQIRLLRELVKCAAGSPFAELCEDMAGDLLDFTERASKIPALRFEPDMPRMRSLILTNGAVEFVARLWQLADQLDKLQSEQIALGEEHHRRLRVLKAAEIPLWALSALGSMPEDCLTDITPEKLLALSVQGSAGRALAARDSDRTRLLREAETVLALLRVLAVLGMEPASWNDFLSRLTARPEADDTVEASRVVEFAVPPRPCHPPGGLVTAEPRVPRAPGCAVPHRSVHRGRSQLHHRGRRRGRLTA